MGRKKTPKQTERVKTSKVPVQSESVDSIYEENLCWHLGDIDLEGPWGFRQGYSGVDISIDEASIDKLIEEENAKEIISALIEVSTETYPHFESLLSSVEQKLSSDPPFSSIKELHRAIIKKTFFDTVLPKVKEFERKFWKEILHAERHWHHEVEVAKISKEAQKRLQEINLDDTETLVSLRLSSRERLWGIRQRYIFKVLWWDPMHTVYPSTKKHT